MADKKIRTIPPRWRRRRTVGDVRDAGWTLVEMVVVCGIATLLAAGSIPMITKTLGSVHLTSASSSLTSAIQTARYQAISTGCQVQMSISATSYQLSTQVISGTPPACGATFSNLGSAIPYASSDVTLTPTTTQVLQFNPNGTLTASGGTAPQVFTLVLSLTNSTATKTITVSGVGNAKVH